MPIIVEKIKNISIILVDLERATVLDASEFEDIINFEINKGSDKFIFDINACNFIDSTFLSALVKSYKRIAEISGKLKVVGFQPAVKSMFELTQLNRIFEIYTDEQEALMSFD